MIASFEHASQLYLSVVFAITLFRVLVYTFQPEFPAMVKISPDAWKDKRVQEVTRAWVFTIRNFMAFRAMTTIAAMTLEESKEKLYFCIINVLLDVKLFDGMLRNFVYGKENGNIAILHRNYTPPLVLQTIVLCAGIIFAIRMFI